MSASLPPHSVSTTLGGFPASPARRSAPCGITRSRPSSLGDEGDSCVLHCDRGLHGPRHLSRHSGIALKTRASFTEPIAVIFDWRWRCRRSSLTSSLRETPCYYWRGSPGSSNILRLLGPRLVDIRRRARPPLLRGKNSLICGIIDDAA